MRKTVLARAKPNPLKADEIIASQPSSFRNLLQIAADQLATTGRIEPREGIRANLLSNGDWSIWLEDVKGDRHNFVFYVSTLEDGKIAPQKSPARRRLGVYVSHGHAQGSWSEFVEASDYIGKNFSGQTKTKLMRVLEFVYERQQKFDGSIEWTSDGVIVRALAQNQQIGSFEAELRLVWEIC